MKQLNYVSLFEGFHRKEKDLALSQVIDGIKEGLFQKEVILNIRDHCDRGKDYGDLKKKLMAFTPCGTFKDSRKAKDLDVYSKIVILDVDKLGKRKALQVKKKAIQCQYTFAAFISPSGIGLKILVKVNSREEDHESLFKEIKSYYENMLGIEIDPSGKDLSRLCFVSYDSELYCNENSKEFEFFDFYNEIYKDALEKTKAKYEFRDGQRNNFVHYLANNCNRLGLPGMIATAFILGNFNYDEEEVLRSIESAYKNSDEWGVEKNSNEKSLESYLSEKYSFRFNIYNNSIEYKGKGDSSFEVLNEFKLNSLLRELGKKKIKIGKDGLVTRLNSDFVPTYDPLKHYLAELPKWDGETDYISELASRVKTDDDEFFKVAFKKWLVGMVGCGLDDTTINQTAIIFSGVQGLGKSTFIRNILPKELRQYAYSGMINPNSKDTLVLLAERLIIDMDELSSLNRKGNNEVKELITKEKIQLRRPYGRITESYPRRASFAGSVNDEKFLTDMTGNRRFLCFKVFGIDYKSEVNYTGLYGQALALYKDGFKYFFDGKENQMLSKRNESFVQMSHIEELLLSEYKVPDNPYDCQLHMKSSKLLIEFYKKFGVRADNTNNILLGKALSKHGFQKVKRNGVLGYAIDRLEEDEKNSQLSIAS
ncbi:VapE domain-containing protein [Flagellimonas sp.]|uniref:VapE domain-containing protein n=1 Tax=Flagellimonas sp. TaxID=2058762 RepID=UPI003AB67BD6